MGLGSFMLHATPWSVFEWPYHHSFECEVDNRYIRGFAVICLHPAKGTTGMAQVVRPFVSTPRRGQPVWHRLCNRLSPPCEGDNQYGKGYVAICLHPVKGTTGMAEVMQPFITTLRRGQTIWQWLCSRLSPPRNGAQYTNDCFATFPQNTNVCAST